MWAEPDNMKQMLAVKHGHLEAGASCSWVPNPMGAVIHAVHYHQVNVDSVHAKIEQNVASMDPKLTELLTLPYLHQPNNSPVQLSQL